MEKENVMQRQQEIIQLAKDFCNEQLNEEYATLAEKLICKLGRKRNVPFVTGQTAIWAAAVIHALGTLNFLFDKSSEPYATIDDICDFFGTKKNTISGKSKEIRDLLKLSHLDNEFATERMANRNPFGSHVMIGGKMMSVSSILKKFK